MGEHVHIRLVHVHVSGYVSLSLCVCMSSIESVPKIKSDRILFWGLDVERQEDPPFAKPPAAALRAAARHPA